MVALAADIKTCQDQIVASAAAKLPCVCRVSRRIDLLDRRRCRDGIHFSLRGYNEASCWSAGRLTYVRVHLGPTVDENGKLVTRGHDNVIDDRLAQISCKYSCEMPTVCIGMARSEWMLRRRRRRSTGHNQSGRSLAKADNIRYAYSHGYFVNKDGTVDGPMKTYLEDRIRKGRSCHKRPSRLSLGVSNGYTEFSCRDQKIQVHQMVAYQKFGESMFYADAVRHKNNNKLDNSPDNILIGSHEDNKKDGTVYTEMFNTHLADPTDDDIAMWRKLFWPDPDPIGKSKNSQPR